MFRVVLGATAAAGVLGHATRVARADDFNEGGPAPFPWKKYGAAVAGAGVVAAGAFLAFATYRVAPADALLVFTGAGVRGIRIARTGFNIPVLRRMETMKTSAQTLQLTVADAPNVQNHLVTLRMAVQYGPDTESPEALKRYAATLLGLGQSASSVVASRIVAAVRAAIAQRTLKEIIEERVPLTDSVFAEVNREMAEKYGLWVRAGLDVIESEVVTTRTEALSAAARAETAITVAEARKSQDVGTAEAHAAAVKRTAELDAAAKAANIASQLQVQEAQTAFELKCIELTQSRVLAEQQARMLAEVKKAEQRKLVAEKEAEQATAEGAARTLTPARVAADEQAIKADAARRVQETKATEQANVDAIRADGEARKAQKEADAKRYVVEAAAQANANSVRAEADARADALLRVARAESEVADVRAEAIRKVGDAEAAVLRMKEEAAVAGRLNIIQALASDPRHSLAILQMIESGELARAVGGLGNAMSKATIIAGNGGQAMGIAGDVLRAVPLVREVLGTGIVGEVRDAVMGAPAPNDLADAARKFGVTLPPAVAAAAASEIAAKPAGELAQIARAALKGKIA